MQKAKGLKRQTDIKRARDSGDRAAEVNRHRRVNGTLGVAALPDYPPIDALATFASSLRSCQLLASEKINRLATIIADANAATIPKATIVVI